MKFTEASLEKAFTELLGHRTYLGAHIQLRVFDGKLSIWNEGGLPFGLTLDDLKKEHNSRPRNPKIAKACFMAGYIDTWGRGTLKIINSCKEAGLPDPEIKETNGGIEITLFNNQKSGQIGGQNGGQIGGQIGGITDRQKAVLLLIVKDPKITRKLIAQNLAINESAVQKHLKTLINLKIIERVGTKKGFWKLLIDI
jgi:ATP-dependent DNA helicase RecG